MARSIQTTYYSRGIGRSKQEVKVNLAKHARTAVLNAIDHMQMDHYGAAVAEVYDLETGELHAVITSAVTGKLSLVFLRDPKSPVCLT